MSTYTPKKADITHDWHLIDAEGQTLGRLACQVAQLLRGKHKPGYANHVDVGDYVVVINAGKVTVTGRKAAQKIYYRHSGYPGGLKEESYERLIRRKPERVIEHAVKGMLPKTALGRHMYGKLRVYAGARHPHQGQVPAAQSTADESA